MTEAVIIEAVRTPIGRFGGALSSVRPDDLAATVLQAAVERTGIDPQEVDDVYLGCANQAGEDNRNVARMAGLLAGLPESVPGATVNRLCGSGMEAVAAAARAIRSDEGQLFLAGGVESMSRAPWAVLKPERGFPRGAQKMEDTALGWRFVNPQLEALGHTDSLGQTAENVAREHGITREQQDQFALASQLKASNAIKDGRFESRIVPVITPSGETVDFDEGPRPDTTLEKLAALRPVFASDGSVTAGNSSPLNDGAASLVVCSEQYAESAGLRPRLRILGAATAGVAPRVMGLGPIPATERLLGRLEMQVRDFDVIELNEAFASQAVAVCRAWGVDPEDDRLNPNGGAIALGHPLGCSGARLVGDLLYELERRQGRYGLATMCIGVGQGIAMAVERVAVGGDE